MTISRRLITKLKRAIGVKVLPELDPRFTVREAVFKAPPLTSELVAAIRLISPQCDLGRSEKCRQAWEADQNGACWGEFEALAPLFRSMTKPRKILEIGPGMGRSLVFFSKQLGWERSEIHAYEGDGSATKYTTLGPRFEDSFCGNIKMLDYVLEYNGIRNVRVINSTDVQLRELPGPYDLIYSFYSIGFHWSLEHFMDDLWPLFHERTVAVFMVPQEFKPFPLLNALPHALLDGMSAWPKNGRLKLLVLGKVALPE